MTDIHDLSANELLQRYRAKTLSPTEVFAAVEKHIARWEPHLKALYAYEPDAARKEAAASTERWAKGAPMGALDGVPVTVKENIASKGTADAARQRCDAADTNAAGCAARPRACARRAPSSSPRPRCRTTA